MAMKDYIADESRLTVQSLEFLLTPEGRDLLARAADVRESTPAAIAKLRKNATAEQVHAALITAEVRRKAAGPKGKFPEIAESFFSPPEALEQATGLSIARYKAEHFQRLNRPLVIVDFCAGVGGDTLGFAGIAPTVAIEMSPVRAWCLQQNAAALGVSVEVIQDDLLSVLPTLQDHLVAKYPDRLPVFHIDPARRSAGKRSHAYEDLIPGPEVIDRLIASFAAGLVKLSPAVEFSQLPLGALEVISDGKHAVQAVLWTGDLAADVGTNTRIASIVPPNAKGGSFFGIPGAPDYPQSPQKFMYEIDPAFHRAGVAPALARMLKLVPINTDGGYLTSADLLSDPLSDLCLAPFQHIATVPFRDIRKALAALPPGTPGPVEVKTRGGLDIDPDQLQKEFTRISPAQCTVLVYRAIPGIMASIAKRI